MVSRSRGFAKKFPQMAHAPAGTFFFLRAPADSAFLLFFVIDTVRGLLFHNGF